MFEAKIRNYSTAKNFHPQTVARWLSWKAADADALAGLAIPLKVSENHLRDLMDWLEEIALRDGSTIHAILASKPVDDIATDPRLGRADRIKQVREYMRRLRFPRLAATEDAIRAQIKELKLHPEIRLTVPPGLEGGRIRIELTAASLSELRQLAAKLSVAADQRNARILFDLLAGGSTT